MKNMISSPWLAEMNVSVGEDSLLFTACQSRDGGLATSQHERGIERSSSALTQMMKLHHQKDGSPSAEVLMGLDGAMSQWWVVWIRTMEWRATAT